MNVKEMKSLKHYAVVSLRKTVEVAPDIFEEVTTKVFLTPGSVLTCHLKSYKEDRYRVYSIYLCDYEDYLNEKVKMYVDDLQYTEESQKRIKEQFKRNKMTLGCYIETLEMLNDFRMTTLKQLYMVLNRLWRNDFTCKSELAIELYNYWFA